MKIVLAFAFLLLVSCTAKDRGLQVPQPRTTESEKPAETSVKTPEVQPGPASEAPEVVTPVEKDKESVVDYKITDKAWFQKLKTGDVVFIQGTSQQGASIIEATGSLVTHMGMIVVKDNAYFVAEAVEPVKMTPLVKFITPARVKSERLIVKRLDDSKLPIKISPSIETDLIQEFYKYNNKKYDLLFQWSDEKIYCSELVYKIFKKVLTIDVGTVVFTRELNMGPEVVSLIKKRFGVQEGTLKFNNVYDKVMNEKIITPVSMFDSEYFYKTPVIDFSKNKLK